MLRSVNKESEKPPLYPEAKIQALSWGDRIQTLFHVTAILATYTLANHENLIAAAIVAGSALTVKGFRELIRANKLRKDWNYANCEACWAFEYNDSNVVSLKNAGAFGNVIHSYSKRLGLKADMLTIYLDHSQKQREHTWWGWAGSQAYSTQALFVPSRVADAVKPEDKFYLGHELAHLHRGHLNDRWLSKTSVWSAGTMAALSLFTADPVTITHTLASVAIIFMAGRNLARSREFVADGISMCLQSPDEREAALVEWRDFAKRETRYQAIKNNLVSLHPSDKRRYNKMLDVVTHLNTPTQA